MDGELFYLRDASEDDIAAMDSYTNAEGMDRLPDVSGCIVAVSRIDDAVIGFIRVVWTDGCFYINPIVVYPTWRRHNVGTALVEKAFEKYRALRLVARGGSVPFYTSLGFHTVPWDSIADERRSECDGCEMYDECTPQPMEGSRYDRDPTASTLL